MENSTAVSHKPTDGLSREVRNVLFNTFVTVGGLMAITAVGAGVSLDLQLSPGATLTAVVALIAMIFAIHYFRKSGFGLALLAVFAALQGVVLGPIINQHMKMQGGASVVATAAGLTALAVLGCAAYVITSKRDFSRIGGFLCGATLVLLLGMVLAVFLPIPALHVGLSAAGALIFMAWVLHDVSDILHGRETNYVTASLSIYLDTLNIFLSILRLLGLAPRN